jgi:pimeloyl-ACP methyl ester carboxylesterase
LHPQDKAFHVVAPDLPGYGFSAASSEPGFGRAKYAAACVALMHELSYERFAIYSTDLGLVVGLTMVEKQPELFMNHITISTLF